MSTLYETEAPSCPHSAPRVSNNTDAASEIELSRSVSTIESMHREDSIGVLLVNHGSHSRAWRSMLLDVHDQVAPELLRIPGITQVRTAFMEYTEPSIATQLRAFDESGIKTVVVVPLLLTISDHTFDDIPTICGRSHDPECVEKLQSEHIEIYNARCELRFAPLLDFPGLAKSNLTRRVRAALGRRERANSMGYRDGIVLVGYGSAEFDDDWQRFFMELRNHAENQLGLAHTAHAWCGHIVRYKRQPTIDAIDRVLESADRALVVPILVAYDEMFQDRIIGGAVERCSEPHRVLYRADAILPEPDVGRWILKCAKQMSARHTGSIQ